MQNYEYFLIYANKIEFFCTFGFLCCIFAPNFEHRTMTSHYNVNLLLPCLIYKPSMLNCAVIVRLLCGYCAVIVRLLCGVVPTDIVSGGVI